MERGRGESRGISLSRGGERERKRRDKWGVGEGTRGEERVL